MNLKWILKNWKEVLLSCRKGTNVIQKIGKAVCFDFLDSIIALWIVAILNLSLAIRVENHLANFTLVIKMLSSVVPAMY